jgi:hypothetical protein
MGMSFKPTHAAARMLPAVLGLFLLAGCQMGPSISTARLIQHQAFIDPTGLKESQVCAAVKVHVSAPQKWVALEPKHSALYTHMQWRSPSKMTGLGVCYIHLPLPLPADMIVWLAEKEYSKKSDDGRIIAHWEDAMGRPWFEAENNRYHVRGYVVTKGFEAWIIYCGYKREQPPRAAEMGVAARALETIVPTPFAREVPQRPLAAAQTAEATLPGKSWH